MHAAANTPAPSDDNLGDQIALLSTQIDAATYRLLTLIREFDNQQTWAELDCLSCAHWMSWRLGMATSTARDKLRVAHALAQLPAISAIVESGQISYSKARAVTRVATTETDAGWANIALEATASQLEQIVSNQRRENRIEEIARTNNHEKHRALNTFYDEDGMLVIQGRLPPEAGEVLMKALAANQHWDNNDERTFNQRQADALVELARGHEGSGRSQAESCVVLHVDQEVLANPAAPGRCELESGPAVSAETARRLSCDGHVLQMTHGDQGQVLSVGKKKRVLSAGLKRALRFRDKTCRFPGCTHQIVDAHHIKHWCNGGETKLDNLVQLCRRHHVLLHEGHYRIEVAGNETLMFLRPDGAVIPNVVAPPGVASGVVASTALAAMNASAGIYVDTMTGYPRWDGSEVDYGYIADVMEQAHPTAARP